MVEIRNITKTYKSKAGCEIRALNNVSLQFLDHGLTFIVGRSGSGKSTLLNVIGGLDSFDEGDLIVDGSPVKASDDRSLDEYRNKSLGFIFQEYNLIDSMSIEDNIKLALELQGKPYVTNDVHKVLNDVELNDVGMRYPAELSGGQKQRVAIARALIKNPKIILADEPTGNLDYSTGKEILELLRELSSTRLVIVVTHDIHFANEYGDRIIELGDGRVINDTCLKELANSEICGITTENAPNQKPNIRSGNYRKEKKHLSTHLSAKFSFKFVFANFKRRKLRLTLSLILCIVALTLFGMALTLSAFDGDLQVYKNLNESGAKVFTAYKTDGADGGSFDVTSEALAQLGYDNPIDSLDINILNGKTDIAYAEIADFNDYFIAFGDDYRVWYDGGYADKSFILNSSTDLEKFGFTLKQGSAELDSNNGYVTDAFILKLLAYKQKIYKFYNGNPYETERIENTYYIYENGKYIKLSEEYNVEDILGATIYKMQIIDGETAYTKMFKISGIVETDYKNYLDHELSAKEGRYFDYMYKNVWFRSFINRDCFLLHSIENYSKINTIKVGGERNPASIYYNNTLVKQQFSFKHAVRDARYNSIINGDAGSNYYTPDDGNVAISLQLYNAIFKTSYAVEDIVGYRPEWDAISSTVETVPYIKNTLNSIGERIQICVRDASGNALYNLDGIVEDVILDNYLNEIVINKSNFQEALILTNATYGFLIQLPQSRVQAYELIGELHSRGVLSFGPYTEDIVEYSRGLRMFKLAFLISACILIVFSVLMLFNFISTNAADNKREIGILRALGARKSDITRTFEYEGLIISFITALISSILIIVMTFLMNLLFTGILNASGVLLLSLSPLAIACSVMTSFVVVALAASLPVIKIARMRPVDAIKKTV